MALPPRGTLTGDLGDALGGSPSGAGTLWLTPPTVVAYADQGYTLLPQPIAVPVAADGTITATAVARTDLGNPAGWAYVARADVPGLPETPFAVTVVSSSQDIAAGIVSKPGHPEWLPTITPHDHDPRYYPRAAVDAMFAAATGTDMTMYAAQPAPANGSDWNTLAPGIYNIKWTGLAYINAPIDSLGVLTVKDPGHANGVRIQIFEAYANQGIWYRSTNAASTPAWGPWVRIDDPDRNTAAQRAVLESAARSRRGIIGTNGKGAIALRFDHHWDQFVAKVLPLLDKYSLPWAQATNPGTLGTGNDNVTMAQIQDYALANGGEIANHSRTHASVTGPAIIHDEIVGSLTALKSGLPKLAIEAWMPPGQTAGTWDGYMPSATAEQHDTYAGHLAIANHAFVTGYMPQPWRPLDGHLDVGIGHKTADTAQEYHLNDWINRARDTQTGLMIMLHPNLIDQPGYITLAALDSRLGYIAAQRDLGNLEVLTPTSLMLADSNRTTPNLATGTKTAGNTWTQTITLAESPGSGAVWELALTHTETSGILQLATDTGQSVTRTITKAGTSRRLITVGTDATTITATITGTVTGTPILRIR